MFMQRDIATHGRKLPSGNFHTGERTMVGWMSGVKPRKVGIPLSEGQREKELGRTAKRKIIGE
jgi:hypothetical protein